MTIRRLKNNERTELEAFLIERPESSMFLLSNLRRSGLDYEDKPFHADYYASFSNGGEIDGVLAHCWNGNILLQAPNPEQLLTNIKIFRRETSRTVAGVLGPSSQVGPALTALQLQNADYAINVDDGLFALELDKLILPAGLSNPDIEVVHVSETAPCFIGQWIKAYEIEALGKDDDEDLERSVASRIARLEEWRDLWILQLRGAPVAMSGFSARLTDIVQIGPVWTPPEHRNRQYARILLAATLRRAATEGIERAVLFANDPAAIRSYEAIGFKRIDNYQLAMLKKPIDIMTSD